MRLPSLVLTLLLLAVPAACGPAAEPVPTDAPPAATTLADTGLVVSMTARAPDGVALAYDVRGQGEVALVFVHGWSCNREFWEEQIDAFAADYRVVTLDLGGHGESGDGREAWTVAGLGADVAAVADALALEKMVLVGHSMGAAASLEAARLMPGRVLGVVAVDALQDPDFRFPEEASARMLAAFEADFVGAIERMFTGMSGEGMADELRAWIVERAVAARPEVATPLLADFSGLDFPALFSATGAPIRAINAASDSYPTSVENGRKYADFDAVIMEGVSHFLHLEKPEEFNEHLRACIEELTAPSPA